MAQRRRPRYLSFRSAAKEYGLSEACLRRAIHDGENPLPYYVPNGQTKGWRVTDVDVEEWLARSRRVLPAPGSS